MAVKCPYCQVEMNLKDPKPGKYVPKCRKCEKRFVLVVPENGGAPVASHYVEANDQATAMDPGTAPPATAASPKTKVVQDTAAARGTEADVERTFVAPASAAGATNNASAPMAQSDQANQLTNRNYDSTQAAPATAAQASAPGAPSHDIPDRLGGYKIVKELGRGGMGAVFLAKQLSLDRNVALKTIQSRWSNNPIFLARFIREAYAAAQLTHHNVIQIYDLGEDRGTNFFSMEFVSGHSIADEIQKKGPLDPLVAVNYAIQAARGLQFAHAQGLIHRDVKPANLMINDQGIVKVADLGLVKTPELEEDEIDEDSDALTVARANVTTVNARLGTPAYMSPEQAENASKVDHRADIYSFGCTLYAMLSGRPPFRGESAVEVISKHKSEKPQPVDKVIPNCSPELAAVVQKMMAKNPADRYANFTEVIEVLQKFLERAGKDRGPTTAQTQVIRSAAEQFHGNAGARLLRMLAFTGPVAGVLLSLPLLAVSTTAAGWLLTTTLVASTLALTLSAVRFRSLLSAKLREYLWSCGIKDWLTFGGTALLTILILLVIGGPIGFVAGLICGALIGAGIHFGLDAPARKSQATQVEIVNRILTELRANGLDESSIIKFVGVEGGNSWEAIFEAVFGYDELNLARQEFAKDPKLKSRPKLGGLSEMIALKLAATVKERKNAKDQLLLQKVEVAKLRSQGVNAADAQKQAEATASAMVEQANLVRQQQAILKALQAIDPAVAAKQKRERVKAMLADARSGKYQKPSINPIGLLMGTIFGIQTRLVIAILLILGCAMWVRQNQSQATQLIDNLKQTASDAQSKLSSTITELKEKGKDADVASAGTQVADSLKSASTAEWQPVTLPVVGPVVSNFNGGIAGLLLLASIFAVHWRAGLLAIPGALIAFAGGKLGIPKFEMLGVEAISLLIGCSLICVGIVIGRLGRT